MAAVLPANYVWMSTPMSRIGRKYCLISTSYLAGLFDIFILLLIIHQIYSLARDWSKHVTWPNIPQLQLGNIRVMLKTVRVAKKIWGIINTIASTVWGKNMLGYLSLDIICSSKLTVFRERNVPFSEQKISADKYPSIFSRQMEAIVYLFDRIVSVFVTF